MNCFRLTRHLYSFCYSVIAITCATIYLYLTAQANTQPPIGVCVLVCELTSECSNSSINGTESVYGYSMYFILFLFSFYPSFIFMSMKLFVCVCLSAYLHQYSNVCSVCTHSVATQRCTFIPQTLPVETTRYTITHRMHTHSCLCRYTLHLVATSAPLHTDQRSHSRFRPHSLF